MAQKRRITPIMVSSEVSAAGQVPQLQQQAAPAAAKPSEGAKMSQKEQADEAAKVLGPGRHIHVELTEECTEVSWPRLLKERGVRAKKTSRDEGQGADLAADVAPQAGPVFKDPPRRGGGQSVLSNVIHKLEQQFVMNDPDDSDEEAGGAADKGAEEAIPDTVNVRFKDDDAADNEDEQGGFNDLYDMDDEFIDDTEMQDYFGSDRRKTKYSGFFINKGEIEKTDEEIALAPDSPPKKKRRMKKPENGVAKAGAEGVKRKTKRPRADEAEDADQAAEANKQSRKLQSSQPGEDIAAAADKPGGVAAPQAIVSSAAVGSASPGLGGTAGPAPSSGQCGSAAAHEDAAHPSTTQAQALFGTEVAAAALPVRERNVARKSIGGSELPGLAGAPEDGAQEHSELNKEVLANIEKLKRAAEKQPAPQPSSGAAKQMPAALRAPVKALALAVMRQAEKQKGALKIALDAIMPVMEPHTSRPSLSARIKSEWQKTKVAADRALADLKAEVDRSLLQGGGQSTAGDGDFAAAPGSKELADWTWNEQRKKLVWEALTKVQQVKGGGIGPGRGARIFTQVAEIFPAGAFSKDDMRNVYNEEKEARAARAKDGRQGAPPVHADASQQGSELPASSPGTPYPSSSAAHSSQPRPGSASVRPASAASQEQHAPLQQGSAAAASQPIPAQAIPAQRAPQPLAASAAAPAAPPAAAAQGGAAALDQSQRQPAQALAHTPRPASAAAAGLGGVSEQQTGAEQEEQLGNTLSQALDASQGGQGRRSAAEHAQRLSQAVEAAAAQGADRKQLQSLAESFKKGSTKAIINEVLMYAGPEGLTIPEVIEKANSMELTDPAWEVTTSRKSNLSTVLNGDQKAFVHVGKSRYAHAAHKGVVHLPHAKRRAASGADASQAAAAPQHGGPTAMAPQPSQAPPSISIGGRVASQPLPMQNPPALPHAQIGFPVGPPPARPPPSGFGSLQQMTIGLTAAALQPSSASAADSMPTTAAPIRQ